MKENIENRITFQVNVWDYTNARSMKPNTKSTFVCLKENIENRITFQVNVWDYKHARSMKPNTKAEH